jgi:hypothetical protein
MFNQPARGDGILGARYRHASGGRQKHLVTTTSMISSGRGRPLHFMVEGRGTLDIVNGGVVSRPKAKSVTHVSGTTCHPCLRPLIPIPRRRSLASRRREILTALHWGSPRRFVAGDLAESARAPAPRRELARKRPSNTGQPASRRRNPFAAARATIHPSATPGTPCRQRRAGVAR